MSSKPKNTSTASVIVVGGGTAGAHATATLEDAGLGVTIVEPTGAHQFLTRLAAVAGATQPVGDAATPLGDMFDATVLSARAVSASDNSVTLNTGQVLSADAVLLTAGAEPVDAPIDGLHNALPLRSAADALTIRSILDDTDAMTIVGGGPTGCQLAGAVATSHPDIALTLVDSSDRLMTAFGKSLGDHARSVLAQRGVDVRLAVDAEEMSETHVTLSDGTSLKGSAVWAAGYESTMEHFGPTTDGRLEIEPSGRVIGSDTMFAAGDNAAHRDANGDLHPMSAQIAAQAGRQVAKNIAATLNGADSAPLDLKDRGWVVDLGGGVGVAELLGLTIATSPFDRLVPLLHTAIDLRNLFQLGGIDFVRRFRPGSRDRLPVAPELRARYFSGDAGAV